MKKMPREIRKCLMCPIPFEVIVTSKRKFCCEKCRVDSQIKHRKEERLCKNCGGGFIVKNNSKQKYCNNKCKGADPDFRKNNSNAHFKYHAEHPERGRKHSQYMTQFYVDHPEHREERREEQLKRFEDPKEHILRSESAKKVYIDKPELKDNASIKETEKWADPVYAENQKKAIKDGHNTPEAKENYSKGSIKRFSKPEERSKASKRQKKRLEDPKERELNKKRQKQVYIDHPEKRSERGEVIKQFYIRFPEKRLERSENSKIIWQDYEFQKMMAEAFELKPNKPEIFLIGKLNELQPDKWIYVGDFSFWVGGKNPDFVNQSEMKLIEFFGCFWHYCEKCYPRTPKKQDTLKERIQIFKDNGYQTLIIWEHEMKDNAKVMRKIKTFLGN